MKYIQTTTVNGVSTGHVIERTPERMVEMLAQVSFLRQAGEDIELHQKTDGMYRQTAYIITRRMKDRIVVNHFEVVRD